MTPQTTHSDRESLSALFDGELRGDAARFALKRLGHDADWQQACGRWQLIGDAMRGQATLAAPGDLAARVAAALVPPPAVQTATPVPKPASRLRRWVGGAMAASVAAAALLLARPLWQAPTAAPMADARQARAAGVPAAPAPAAMPADPAATLAAGAAVAVAALPPRTHVARRNSPRPRALRRDAEPVQAVASAIAHPAALHAVAANPFVPPQADIVTRPWPRAALPAVSAAGALTASFGGGAETPSFYPFEPRVPAADDAAPTPGVPQR